MDLVVENQEWQYEFFFLKNFQFWKDINSMGYTWLVVQLQDSLLSNFVQPTDANFLKMICMKLKLEETIYRQLMSEVQEAF